ncbi:MAG: GDP-mannose 4,6-dehydratase [Planctomycetes bacterium]|nr:GDP-mannose 4,6-dehydratase [Planctomycetota bacterium]
MGQQRWAVLGSNSFSGSDLIDLLLEDPASHVLGLSRSPQKGPAFLPYLRHGGGRFRFEQADLNLEMGRVLGLLDGFRPQVVVNFAAQSEVAPSWEHPDHWFRTNTVALAELVNSLRRRDYLRRYVHVSSPEVYGSCSGVVREDAPLRPSTPYAASKAAADLLLATYARQFGFPVVTVRSTNVYGAHQQLHKIIPRTAVYLRLGRTIELHGGGCAVKSYIHVRDVSRGERAIAERGRPGEVYHLSPDAGVAVREVVRRICLGAGADFERATRVVDERPGQDAAYVIDSTRARTELGWSPSVGLDEGIARVIEWVDSRWDEIQGEPLEYRHRP